MKKLLTKEEIQKIKPWFILGVLIITFYMMVNNMNIIINGFIFVLKLLKPLLLAIAFAYILNIPMSMIERVIKRRVKKDGFIYKRRRGLSVTLTILLALIVMVLIVSIIVPRMAESLVQLFSNMGKLLENIFDNIDHILATLHIDYRMEDIKQVNNLINMPWNEIFKNVVTVLGESANGILSNAMNFTSTFLLWFMAFMFSLYLLNGKETLLRQLREVILVICKEEKAKQIYDYGKQANIIFKNFVSGQLVEACILGVIYYLGMKLFNFPYPELIAMIIAVFSLVPVFGPICAMFIGAFLILSKDPLMALWFFVFFQILSQLEDNYIYPKVVGNSVGLPGLWVILSIFVLGDLFGIVGMITAVPITAFIYTLFSRWIHYVLNQRKMKVDYEGNIEKIEGKKDETI